MYDPQGLINVLYGVVAVIMVVFIIANIGETDTRPKQSYFEEIKPKKRKYYGE